MNPLGLSFLLDDLLPEGRPFRGELSQKVIEEAVGGLVGQLGYRARGAAPIEGTAYRSAKNEVVIDGRVFLELGYDCVRCLESRTLSLRLRVDHVLVKVDRAEGDGDVDLVVEEDEDEDDVLSFVGERVELADIFREDILLELPMNPACEHVEGAEACPSPVPEVPEEEQIDPRWAPLLDMKKKLT